MTSSWPRQHNAEPDSALSGAALCFAHPFCGHMVSHLLAMFITTTVFDTVPIREMLAKNDNGFADTDGTFCYIKNN